jgi:peptide/nickel transport system permease protein
MARYLLRRVIEMIVVLLVLAAVVYVIFYLLPGNPARLACGKICPPDQLAQIEHKLGLDEPVYLQFWHFLEGLAVGRDYSSGPSVDHCPAPCLGFSFQTDQPVTGLLADRLPVSVSIVSGALVLWLLIGAGTGVVSALRRGRLADRVLTAITLAGSTAPATVVGLVLLLVFSLLLGWLPPPTYVGLTTDPVAWARNLVLPWLTIALIQSALYARITRTSLLETLNEDHIRTARAYGLRERTVIGRHAMRGALTPLITLAALDTGYTLGNAVLTESLFGMPGIGKLTVDAVKTIDLPVVTGLTLLIGASVIVANTVADLLYMVADRRVTVS